MWGSANERYYPTPPHPVKPMNDIKTCKTLVRFSTRRHKHHKPYIFSSRAFWAFFCSFNTNFASQVWLREPQLPQLRPAVQSDQTRASPHRRSDENSAEFWGREIHRLTVGNLSIGTRPSTIYRVLLWKPFNDNSIINHDYYIYNTIIKTINHYNTIIIPLLTINHCKTRTINDDPMFSWAILSKSQWCWASPGTSAMAEILLFKWAMEFSCEPGK